MGQAWLPLPYWRMQHHSIIICIDMRKGLNSDIVGFIMWKAFIDNEAAK